MMLLPPVYPYRHFVNAGECGKQPLKDLVAWAQGGTFHRYGVQQYDRGPLIEEALERMREHPPLVEFTSEIASHHSLDWTLKFRQAGDLDSWGMTRPHMTPEDAAYAALTMIEEHDRELYEQSLVEGLA